MEKIYAPSAEELTSQVPYRHTVNIDTAHML